MWQWGNCWRRGLPSNGLWRRVTTATMWRVPAVCSRHGNREGMVANSAETCWWDDYGVALSSQCSAFQSSKRNQTRVVLDGGRMRRLGRSRSARWTSLTISRTPNAAVLVPRRRRRCLRLSQNFGLTRGHQLSGCNGTVPVTSEQKGILIQWQHTFLRQQTTWVMTLVTI